MKKPLSSVGLAVLFGVISMFALLPSTDASIAYGTLNNFDCVNDTGVETHGFEIELDDLHSTDITYTYDYNHYGIPKIREDKTDPAHPKVFIRYAATKLSDGTWSAYTAIPAGPITPTDGHQFTNPNVNFGGEHFGAGYYGAPTAVKYNWLIDDGTGNLVHGPPVYIATPTFTYYPPAALPAQVQAAIVLPPPEVPPVLQFGEAMWVNDIKTTTHNAEKVELRDLVDPDPENPDAKNWANGEPAEVESEWRILQTEFADAANPKGVVEGVPQELPEGNEVVTRRYEFYKYIGPIDAESGEAMADQVGPDGIHGVGSVTYNHHWDPVTGEWVEATTNLSTVEVVGDFIGAQMSGFDVAPILGLIDHIPDGELGVAYANRTVVVAGGAAFFAATSGSLPDGTTLNSLTGVFSGTPTVAGVFIFTVDASDTSGAAVSKIYTVTIPAAEGEPVTTSTITTSASPVAGGSTIGDGMFENGTPVTVVATHSPGFAFVNWTEGGVEVSASAVYPFTLNADRQLVANFVPTYTVTTTASPTTGGTTSGDGTYNSGDSVTVVASENAGYNFVNWTEGDAVVSASASYTFAASANRDLVANFARITYTIGTSASPIAGGTANGGGTVNSGDSVTVVATPNPGFTFANWTEGSAIVSSLASYTFTASANRDLVANFVTPILDISEATAIRNGSKVDVTVTIRNSGRAAAQAVTIDTKKDATIDRKATQERAPVVFGNIAPDGTAITTLTFAGVKAGTRMLNVTLTYTDGTATLSTLLTIP